MRVDRTSLRPTLMRLFSGLAFWFLASHQPAEAQNVHCEIPFPSPFNFGTSQTQTFSLAYRCTNESATQSRTHTLCLRRGNPQFPAVGNQPAMQMGKNVLLFNLFRDAARLNEWALTNYITKQVTLAPRQVLNDSFTFYGMIQAGQNVPTGNYLNGILNNTLLGTLSGGQCLINATNFQGQDTNLNFQATVAAGCTLGARTAINFGTQPGLVERADATGAVQLTCPLSRAWTLRFDGGRNASSGVRRMRSAAGAYVPYRIYRDAGRSNAVAIDGTIAGTGTGTAQTTPIYGRTEPPSPPAVGTYQDFIVVTLSF